MTNLIEKYLGEAHGRGMMRKVTTRNPSKLASILKKSGIKFNKSSNGIMVGDDDYEDVEELMAKNNLF